MKLRNKEPKVQSQLKRRENLLGWAFVTPSLLAFILFVIFPFIAALLLSFTEWNFLSGLSGIKWVGMKNFLKIASNEDFKQAIVNTLIYVVASVPTSLILALVIAYILNGEVFGRKALRLAFFLPYISSAVAIAATFRLMFSDKGIINNLLMNWFGMTEPIRFMVMPKLMRYPVILILLIQSVGYEMVVYMAALQSVPKELYESSRIDGASSFKQFTKITMPLISPTTFYLVIVKTIGAFKVFSSINIFTTATPMPEANSIVTEIYTRAFGRYQFGYASAESFILFLILLLITLIQFWGQKKWVHYD